MIATEAVCGAEADASPTDPVVSTDIDDVVCDAETDCSVMPDVEALLSEDDVAMVTVVQAGFGWLVGCV